MTEFYSSIVMVLTSPVIIFYCAVGTFAGIYIGAIPGLSVTMAAALLISFTFSWDVLPALALICGVYLGGVYGGSRSAILLNIPGAPASVATALDGYPLAKLGLAGEAIGIATIVSVFGGFVGFLVLMVAGPLVSRFAINFASRDYMLMALIGIFLVGTIGDDKDAKKGIFAALFGLFVSVIGIDTLTGEGRYTFGSVQMMSGIHYVTVMIGMFGISEVLVQLHTLNVKAIKQELDKIVPSFGKLIKYLPLSIRSSIIGVIVGAIPGTGGDIAAILAYGQAKKTVKNPSRPFGEGAYEGLIAAESSNNAMVGGAFIPMLTLGIPGDAVTAIIIGALYIHGLKPGPLLMVENPGIFWFVVTVLIVSNLFLIVFGLTGIKLFAKVVEVPKGILLPVIVVLSVVGSYSIQNSVMDIVWMMLFGVIGYFMKMYNFSTAPMILGIILGPLIEASFRRAVLSVNSSLPLFFRDLVVNPISAFLTLMLLAILVSQLGFVKRLRNKS